MYLIFISKSKYAAQPFDCGQCRIWWGHSLWQSRCWTKFATTSSPVGMGFEHCHSHKRSNLLSLKVDFLNQNLFSFKRRCKCFIYTYIIAFLVRDWSQKIYSLYIHKLGPRQKTDMRNHNKVKDYLKRWFMLATTFVVNVWHQTVLQCPQGP